MCERTISISRMSGFRRNMAFSQMSRECVTYIDEHVLGCVIRNNVIGDTKIPLWHIVPIRINHGDYTCKRYDTPIYTRIFQAGKNIVTSSSEKTRTPHPVMNNQQLSRRWAVY